MQREKLNRANNITETIDKLNNALNELNGVALANDEHSVAKVYLIGWLNDDKDHLRRMITDYIDKLEKELESL